MPKAILIMDDMPECCADCPCSFFERDNPILNLICGVTQEDAYNVGKPDWCPLRELPEKIPELKSGYEDISTSIRRVGWNACLDEIVKTDGMRKE
jgi:hypothetical protein